MRPCSFALVLSLFLLPAAAAPQPEASAPQLDAEAYQVRLVDLQRRIEELRERVFRIRTVQALLTDSGPHVIAAARASIDFRNELGAGYSIIEATFAIDGRTVLHRVVEPGGDVASWNVFEGLVAPGEHEVTAIVRLRGDGLGVFRYVEGYGFRVATASRFTVAEDLNVSLRIVAVEQGGPTTPFEERPTLRVQIPDR